MPRRWAPIAFVALLAQPAAAIDVTVTAAQLTRFKGVELDQPVDKLIFRGGMTLQAQDDMFGGLSSITTTGPNQDIAFITDPDGYWIEILSPHGMTQAVVDAAGDDA